MLTAEYIHGYKVSDVTGIKEAGLDLKDVDRKLVNAFAEQIFHTGFVHADPHPGNSKFHWFPFCICLSALYILYSSFSLL